MHEKMNIYLIHAYEGKYGGLHGMESCDIVETDNEQEVNELGYSMSIEVMESYYEITDWLEEEAAECGYDKGTDEYDQALENVYDENVIYEYWRLSNKHTLEEYQQMLANSNGDWEELQMQYAINE